ncbi:MAG: Gfo/Idh/MocA family protein [Thermomicrobiales bacterium]
MTSEQLEGADRKVRVALVGCGKIAATHALALSSLEEAEWVACCDRDVERAREMAAKYNVPHVFADAEELFASGLIEATLVCTPHPAHEAVVVAAAHAGIHVLCEKPIATTLGEADRMIEAADKAGTKFGVIFQRRFWPAAQRIRSAIDDGKLGNLTLGECNVRLWRGPDYFALDPWRGKWATEGGGILMNQAVHSIDHFQWFMGRAVEVYGKYATLRHGAYIDVEDTAAATIVLENGALGTLTASSTFQPAFGFRVAVHGDSGAAVSMWERNEGELGVNDLWSIPGEESLRKKWFQEDDGIKGFPQFHIAQIQDFLQAVRDDRAPAVTGAEARKSLEIILAIYESSRTGLPVKLPM